MRKADFQARVRKIEIVNRVAQGPVHLVPADHLRGRRPDRREPL
ncbi:hypothetical protein Tph_c11940 [Thermacetogenium phaeum DSM 12270]|jgi:hypothetical protein|uniref:Uncharacterized protein n=1 Tax=Thermacetogenium phaeum (strain ATCC BAA-254 / DSM 26808 / PB) TaxID=1089553 RepID=K4LHI8_THEPS|nr:hypothetical protein [Thermacetogenium phaeum]AFV11415.1 hypothetical protein Tph_c11940 [Thermacetogenium phaeum DSM 12270]